jgi:hypothetical protein
MQTVRLARPVVAGALLLTMGIGLAAAQTAGQTGSQRTQGRRTTAAITPDDPIIPGPDELSVETDSRLFVESFLVALFQEDLGLVYDTYLHSLFTDRVTRDAFVADAGKVRRTVGPLEKIAVLYLREDNAAYDGADGGFADHLLVFQRDPQVRSHVEFRRSGSGLWKVSGYRVGSAQADRLQRAEEASRRALEEAPPEEAGGGEQQDAGEEQPPPR